MIIWLIVHHIYTSRIKWTKINIKNISLLLRETIQKQDLVRASRLSSTTVSTSRDGAEVTPWGPGLAPLDPEIYEYKKVFALCMLNIQWLLSFRIVMIKTPVGKGKMGVKDPACPHSDDILKGNISKTLPLLPLTYYVVWRVTTCHTYCCAPWTTRAICRIDTHPLCSYSLPHTCPHAFGR